MLSKYLVFCKVIETGNFTKTAGIIGYSQSAVSQTVKALEDELGTTLISRKKDGIKLTADGEQYYPYIHGIAVSEEALDKKCKEMHGFSNSIIRIGTFTSVSRNLLPGLMKRFKELHKGVNFVLLQGEYTSIADWIMEGKVDFGFVNSDAVSDIEIRKLYTDSMKAVIPEGHKLADNKLVSLAELSKEPFILLDEGKYSLPLEVFHSNKLEPDIEYKVYDDYSILAMVREGLGVSMMYSKVLEGFEEGLIIRPIKEQVTRQVAIGYVNIDTMPLAARSFVKFICDLEA